MNVTLKSEQLTVVISTHGAELQSVRTPDGLELIWQGDKAIWNRHAPLLFPIIGRLKNQRYTLDGESISISQHGFGRDSDFEVVSQSASAVTFRLTDSPETRKVYPFAFSLEITYSLVGNVLTKAHTVENRSDRPMPYEVGGHDAYRTTLLPGEQMADYSIEFPGQAAIYPFRMNEDCFLTEERPAYALTDGALPLPPDVFGMDTIVLADLPVNRVTLKNAKNPLRLTVEFPEFPYLGIWTKQMPYDTNYICIEPWSTLPECTFVGSELTDKVGIRVLAPGAVETLSYTLMVER